MATNEAAKQLKTVDNGLTNACPEDMDIEEFLRTLDVDGIPTKQDLSLIPQRQSLTATIDKQAWQAAGISLETAGSVDAYCYHDHGLILIDLNSHEPDHESN